MTSSSEEEGHLIVKEENEDGIWKPLSQSSAFSSYRPVTILTNLQRGNVETTQAIPVLPHQISFHSKAAMGEIVPGDLLHDVNMDAKDENSLTALMWASFYGQLPSVRLLIQNEATIDFEGTNGETALMFAASGGHHEICRLLLSCNSNPNKTDKHGNTALMYAAYSDSAHCVSELLESGADSSLTTNNLEGETPYSIAVNQGCKRAQLVMERFMLRLLEPS